MGKSQKAKGRAQEYLLRNYLRQQGWNADRVYCSGAIKGLPGDVKATHPDKLVQIARITSGKDHLLFEMKSRKSTFQKIYELYEEHVRTVGDDLIALAIPEVGCVNLSSSLDAVLGGADLHLLPHYHPLYKKYSRTFSKIGNLKKLVQECQILAIKDDRRPILFLRFI